jgi:hypothetical protein
MALKECVTGGCLRYRKRLGRFAVNVVALAEHSYRGGRM